MKIDFITDSEADAVLADGKFLAQWRSLWERCPWATAFQSPGFVVTWYAVYRPEFRPLLILSRSVDGTLQGLLTLAQPEAGQKVVFAGRHQAEYHAWICTPELANEFPPRAIEALHGRMPAARLRLHYLAAGIPLDWLGRSSVGRLCFLAIHRRPLLKFGDGKETHASLAKGSNKSKLKRLEKMGGIEFVRITDPEEFDAIFDDIVRLYDLRHAAIHGSGGFHTTSLQKPFHLAMLAVPDLLHLTVMRVGGRLAAAHFGAIGRKEVQLGIIVHDPTLSKQSPGKLLLLLLSKMLSHEGFEQFDLTASGDAYKERFANDEDEVYTLIVNPTAFQRRKTLVRERAKAESKQLLKTVLTKFDINPLRAKLRVKALLRPAYLGSMLVRETRAWIAFGRETSIYRRATHLPIDLDGTEQVRRDALEDLLAYEPSKSEIPRQAFLADALERLESGQHVYTHATEGRLMHVAWLHEPGHGDEPLWPGLALPATSARVETSYTRRGAGSEPSADRCLRAILNDVRNRTGTDSVFIQVNGGCPDARRRVETMGFTHIGSFVEKTTLGRRRRSPVGFLPGLITTAAASSAAPPSEPLIVPPQQPEPTPRKRRLPADVSSTSA